MNILSIIIILFSLFCTLNYLFMVTQDIKKAFTCNQVSGEFKYSWMLKLKITALVLVWLGLYIFSYWGPQNAITSIFKTVAPVMLLGTSLTMAVMPMYIKYVGQDK